MAKEIFSRIRELESELADLWRQVGKEGNAQAEDEFQTLEIVSEGNWFLLPIEPVREVVEIVMPQPLADAPDWVRGTFQFGSQTVPMIDLGRRLGGEVATLVPELTLVILDHPTWLGLLVESVGDVVHVKCKDLSPPPPGIPHASFLAGSVGTGDGRAAHLLSIPRLADGLTQALPTETEQSS